MEIWVKIRALRAQGLGVKKIARQLGIGKGTVRKYLRQEHYPGYRQRLSKLDPFREEIRKRVDQGLTGARILREIREQGYQGGYTILTDFIRTFRPGPEERASVRFETPPGYQGQVDWSDFGEVIIGGEKKRLSCFAMVLSWSRAQYIEFTLSQTLEVFLQCHINAFHYFAGVPCETVYDNLKSVVISRCGRAVEFNRKFLDFAGYYGFEPRPCWPGRARTKGKVERNFQYVDKDFFLGKEFTSLEDLNREARTWLDTVANCRIHGTTNERPFDRLAQEREHLIKIDGREDFDCSLIQIRKVSRDCMVSFEANRYSVPYRLAGQMVFVYASKDHITVRFDGQVVASHQRVYGKGQIVCDGQHYQGLIKPPKCRNLEEVKKEFLELGPNASSYLDGLIQTHKGNARYHAEKILRLKEDYSLEEINQAFDQALNYRAFGFRYIENICHQRRTLRGKIPYLPQQVNLALTGLLRCPLFEIAVERRDLALYAQVAEGR